MPRFKNGLAKVGRVYHYKFEFRGRAHHGSTGCETRAAAEQVLQQLRNNLALEAAGVRQAPRALPTLAKTLEDWTRAQHGASAERHVANVRSAILLHLKPLLQLQLGELDNQMVEDARTAYLNCKGKGHRPGQEGEWELSHTLGGANKVVQHLSSVVGWAVRRRVGALDRMPFKVKPLKPEPEMKSILWPELVQLFIAQADAGRKLKAHAFPHAATAVRMMLALGLREGEALGATWQQLDRRRNVFRVYGHDRELREIPVPAHLLEHLDRVLGPTTALPSGPILLAEDGAPHRAGFTAKPVDRCAAAVGVEGLHPHRLRASFATTHFEAGTPLTQIQQMMGHEDPETTMGYIVQRPKDQAQAQETVADLMGFKRDAPGTILAPSPDDKKKPLKNKAKS